MKSGISFVLAPSKETNEAISYQPLRMIVLTELYFSIVSIFESGYLLFYIHDIPQLE